MGRKDPRIDAAIAKSADFAKPILTHLRKLVHQACPDVEETVKWGMPFFLYRGGILCHMAHFKAHAVFGFWKSSLVVAPKTGVAPRGDPDKGMGQFGKLTSLKDLPSDKAMIAYVKTAMRLNDEGVKSPTRGKNAKAKPPVSEPAYFLAALKRDKAAAATYKAFSPSQKREYVDWVTEAKTEATRESRLATALEWMAEGKHRLWKYQK
ncbi:MAG: YdeI/OmpD-associated family protein [Fibrobacteria bacterium]